MGHLMKTVNPEAAERMEERPLPIIGEMVHYYCRPGERRRGRTHMPAIVVAIDADNRMLTLVVIWEAQDLGDQERVPERMGDDRGWQRMPRPENVTVNIAPAIDGLRSELLAEMSKLRDAIFGDYQVPKKSVLALIDDMDTIVEGLSPSKSAPKAKGPRKGR